MNIQPLVMPQWGPEMTEGTIVSWDVSEGERIEAEQSIVEIMTPLRIRYHFNQFGGCCLRRIVAKSGQSRPVGALIAVYADEDISDAAIDKYILDFESNFAIESKQKIPPRESSFTEIADGKIHYVRQGSGAETVIFLHAFGADKGIWIQTQNLVSRYFTTYSLDLPGHGETTGCAGDGSVSALAQSLASFIEAEKITKLHLVGHSLGGAVAMKYTEMHPTCPITVSLIAPLGFGPEISIELLDALQQADSPAAMRTALEQMVGDPKNVTDDMVVSFGKGRRDREVLSAVRKGLVADGTQAFSFLDGLDAYEVPILIIWGREDRVVPSEHGQFLPTNIGSIRILEAGHWPQFDNIDEVHESLFALLIEDDEAEDF